MAAAVSPMSMESHCEKLRAPRALGLICKQAGEGGWGGAVGRWWLWCAIDEWQGVGWSVQRWERRRIVHHWRAAWSGTMSTGTARHRHTLQHTQHHTQQHTHLTAPAASSACRGSGRRTCTSPLYTLRELPALMPLLTMRLRVLAPTWIILVPVSACGAHVQRGEGRVSGAWAKQGVGRTQLKVAVVSV